MNNNIHKKSIIKIAVIPGDGIGKEVIKAGLEVIKKACVSKNITIADKTFPWGSEYYLKNSFFLPENGLEILKQYDAIYFGAVGHPDVPDHISLWDLRLKICQGLDQYVNIRPTKSFKGIKSPLRSELLKNLDLIMVRENSEGEYSGAGGNIHKGLDTELSIDSSVFTRKGCERIHRYAFDLAMKRNKKKLTLITKSNAQRYGMVLWDQVFYEVKKNYPNIATERLLVDAAAAKLITNPSDFDVIVASNLHADILSDLCSAISGSLGLGASANICADKDFPPMFEPIHGTAFDIVNFGIANPIGAILSGSLMMGYFNHNTIAKNILSAVRKTLSAGVCTPDIGGNDNTKKVVKYILDKL